MTAHELTQIQRGARRGRGARVVRANPRYFDVVAKATAHLRASLAELVQCRRLHHALHGVRGGQGTCDLLADLELHGEHLRFLALARQHGRAPARGIGPLSSVGTHARLLAKPQKEAVVRAVDTRARTLEPLDPLDARRPTRGS